MARKRIKKKRIQQGRCPACCRQGWTLIFGNRYCWHCGKPLGDAFYPHQRAALDAVAKACEGLQ